jgi:serine/threonine-protein phosphatase PGAM5
MVMSRARVRVIAVVALVAWACSAQAQQAFPRTVYLVRHGAYVPDPKADPQLGPAITALGVAQARLVAARLSGSGVSFDSMTSSPLQRARDTAAVMHETLSSVPLSQSPLLRECSPPLYESVPADAAAERTACAKQLDRAFAEFFTAAKDARRNDILVAHGNVIRYLVVKALKVDPRAWLGMSVAHASLTVIQVQPDGAMKVLAVGDGGHIPSPLLSWGDANDRQLVVPASRAQPQGAQAGGIPRD